MAYASRTGTKRNLEALRARGWGLIVSAAGVHRAEGFERYAIDNGAWTAYQKDTPWDESAFLALLEKLGGGRISLLCPTSSPAGSIRSGSRRPGFLGSRATAAGSSFRFKDGMTPADVAPLLGSTIGVFVGGSTEWKLRTISEWARLARERGAYCHVGRVNTVRRIRLCLVAGVDSFDGSSATRFAVNLPRLNNARNQTSWIF
jgi:hypothetical protein